MRLFLLLLVSACIESSPPDLDAGGVERDTRGAETDAGGAATDAGGASDAGRDAGAADASAPFDAGLDAGEAVPDPTCPDVVPSTASIIGAGLTREGLGCFGSCGPECKAECLEDTFVLNLDSSNGGCRRCSYRMLHCKSHAFCRWHDDCYRQCDLRWDEAHAERPPTPPSNPCYLSCDYPVATTHLLCGADWAQQFSSAPEVKDSCWDGSIITSTQLVAQTLTENACPLTTERRPRPFAPNQGTLSASDQPPATITKGFSCTDDTDCADRNQWCDPKAGDSPATNGWGRCVNGRDAGPFDITPVPANGLSLKSVLLQSDAGCWFGFECQSGQCSVRHCR